MNALVQGAYSADWMRMNMARKVSRSLQLRTAPCMLRLRSHRRKAKSWRHR